MVCAVLTVLNEDISLEHVSDELVDAVMQEATFKSTYPNWEVFESVREKYGAIGNFSSDQSKQLGLA